MPDVKDKVLMQELMFIKKEMEEKTGKNSVEEQKKINIAEQERFIKMMRQKKIQSEENKEKRNERDISRYVRVCNFNGNEDIGEIVEISKERSCKEPRNFNYINILMASYLVNGDYKKAELEHKKGNSLESVNLDFLYNSAVMYLFNGKLKDAGECIGKILKVDSDIETMYLMAQLFYLEGYGDKSVQIINKALLSDKNTGRVYRNIMFMILIAGTKEKQIEVLNNLIEEEGKNIGARVALEEFEIENGNKESYVNQERVIKKIIGETEVVNKPCIHVNRAMYYRKIGKYLEAEAEIEKAEKYYPNCICAKTERVRVYIDQKKYEEIYNSAISALKIDLKFKPLLVELLKLCYYLGKDDKIKTISDEIITINKNTKVILKCKNDEKVEFYLENIKENFRDSIVKYKDNLENIELDAGNKTKIYKLMRTMRMCSARELYIAEKAK